MKSRKPGIMQRFGGKYLVYLPEGYDGDPAREWPLILFFHGSGDIGDNPYLLAKASPFMYIREKGPLPCIIAAARVDATGLSLGGEATYKIASCPPGWARRRRMPLPRQASSSASSS